MNPLNDPVVRFLLSKPKEGIGDGAAGAGIISGVLMAAFPEVVFPVLGIAVGSYVSYRALSGICRGTKAVVIGAAKAIRGKPKPPTPPPTVPPPTIEEEWNEVERRYRENCRRIATSRLDEEAKEALLREELQTYEERIRQLLQ